MREYFFQLIVLLRVQILNSRHLQLQVLHLIFELSIFSDRFVAFSAMLLEPFYDVHHDALVAEIFVARLLPLGQKLMLLSLKVGLHFSQLSVQLVS